MKGGIAQSSALDPFLLSISYMNSLPSVITAGTLSQYADDNASSTAAVMNYQL